MCVPTLSLLLFLCLLQYPRPTANTKSTRSNKNNCNARKDSKPDAAKSSALLFAHRCYLSDVTVPIPVPANTIPDIIVPSHVVVQRCSGI